MEEKKSILHELYVYSEWKPEPEYLQKSDNILPENISALWRWIKFFGPKKSLIDSITAFKERQQKWHIALGDEGKVIAVLTDNILEIRTKRSEYATIAARTTVGRDAYPQWRKLVWSPDCSFVAMAYGNGVVSCFDLTASNLFNIPTDCSRPGGLECTDNTHAVAEIIFIPLRVKDTKWNWELLVVTYTGKLRGYLVSLEGFKLHHSLVLLVGVSCVKYSTPHAVLYVAGGGSHNVKDPKSPLAAGLSAWRPVSEEPWYVVSAATDGLPATDTLRRYVPYFTGGTVVFIVHMVISPDGDKLACLHCNGDVTIWRLPNLKLLHKHPHVSQPQAALGGDKGGHVAADLAWWTKEEIIVSRFNGAVIVANVEDMVNILGKKAEFFKGTPRLTCAYDGTFMVLECESNVLPARKSRNDDSMEVVTREADPEDSMLNLTKELFKTVLYAITDIETFQPKPKKITVVSRIYRLLGVKSTTPQELFNRKIESGNYTEALTLAETFNLDSDLVYQQQWRKNPVSTDAIHKYLSKVSKKIWAVHQCVDRLPETSSAANELLLFGLGLTNEQIMFEINKDRDASEVVDPADIRLEDLNAYTSELLRCRHVMLFYEERLRLYEDILRCEKSTYVKDEYDRLRSNSIVHSSMEIAKEGRIEALTCLWPYIETLALQLAVLEKLPETINPIDYQHLLPTKVPMKWFEEKSPIKVKRTVHDNDWCRKEIFRSIWSSNWSEESTPESETANITEDLPKWYEKRAREIEQRSSLVSHALTLVTMATEGGGVGGLDNILFHLLTLDTLIYDINVEGVALEQLEKMDALQVCTLLMKMSTPQSFVADLKQFVIPFLKRYEKLTKRPDACLSGLTDFLESISVDDLSSILLVLQSPHSFELDVRTHLELVERCLFAHGGTEQLDKACDLLDTILRDTDGSISQSELLRRVKELERLVSASSRVSWRSVRVPLKELRDMRGDTKHAANLLTRLARSLTQQDERPTQQDWEKLLKDVLELQSSLFTCITKEQCYEIYASSLLTSGDAASIRLAAEVLTCESAGRRNSHLVNYDRSVDLVSNAAKEYFNSASSLTDPALELARCCLLLIKDGNKEIEQELDLISALQLLSAFNLTYLPIQVRLCEDKMLLIEECLKMDPNGYLASHKLLKLAELLRIAGDDDQTREGLVLQVCGQSAAAAGAWGGAGGAAGAARRLARLRHRPAAALLAHVATHARAHADRNTRRELYAAAVTHCQGEAIEDILSKRLNLELEGLQQMGTALTEHTLNERLPSTDDEFADAITTPVIEKKDLVAPPLSERKVPLINYLLDTLHNKFTSGDKAARTDADRSVRCQEFYSSLYPQHAVSSTHYRYDAFSSPSGEARAYAVLHWYYIQNCHLEQEAEVVQKCAEELLYKDTPLSVACLLRSTQDFNETTKLISTHNSVTCVSSALYATLVRCNAPELRDNVYLTPPHVMARTTLKKKNASQEQLEIIRQCIDKLAGMGEVEQLRELGFSVNGLLFNADEDYRKEMIYRIARSPKEEHLKLACSLASKYDMDPLEVWLHHAAENMATGLLATELPASGTQAHTRIKEAVWPQLRGTDHNTLIHFFNLLKRVDEKPLLWGLTAADHVKLLKKAKAASNELDYKLLVEHPSSEELTSHIVDIMRVETAGLVGKLLRALPPPLRVNARVNTLYTVWLTRHLFTVPPSAASNKKWMQQYRQCASYFNKLSKEDLMQFTKNTSFTREAITRIPASTRNLMIMQAVDYCQQEQENDFKFSKNEQSWAQVGQELTRWARFLENYHSPTVQSIIDANMPKDDVWPEIEMSHGDTETIVSCLARLLLRAEVRASALHTLLQCLRADATITDVLHKMADRCTDNDIQTLVSRATQYHREGTKLPEELIQTVTQKAAEYNLPAHKQMGLLSLSSRTHVRDSGDWRKVAEFSAELFKAEWGCDDLTADELMSEEGRRRAFAKFSALCDTWQRKKALVDVLGCWTPRRDGDSRSLHCEYLHSLMMSQDQKESLVLIKLLLRRPLLTEQEVIWITKNAPSDAIINVLWVTLLSKVDYNKDDFAKLVLQHKDIIQQQEIEDDLVKETLENGLFIKLVQTPLYSSIINYIINLESSVESEYTVERAIEELLNANFIAEAGHLQLLSMGVPSALRGFSQTMLYVKNMFKK